MMGEPDNATDPRRLMELGRERAELEDLVEVYRRFKEVSSSITSTAEVMHEVGDPEMAEMARAEFDELQAP